MLRRNGPVMKSVESVLRLEGSLWWERFVKLMCIGQSGSTHREYYLEDETGKYKLQDSTEERDLGVMVLRNLHSRIQCSKVATKARSVLGMVKRNFRRLDEEDFLIIYKTYVRPHLEYCIQLWSPHLATDVLCPEKIQRAATKIVPGLKKLEYGDRLKHLGLTTLETRRKRGDLIETYNILSGKENIESNKFFELSNNAHNFRGHSMKISVKRYRLNVRKFFFSQRVIAHWNSLPEYVVTAPSTNTFKNQLDKHWTDMDN